MDALIVLSCVALVAFAALCITLIVFALQAKKSMESITNNVQRIQGDVAELKTSAIPVLYETTEVLRTTRTAIIRIEEGAEALSKGAKTFAGIAEDIRAVEMKVLDKVQVPLNDVLNLTTGVVKGVTTFVRTLLNK